MATRIPVSWLLLVVLLGVFAFFGYHIIQAAGNANNAVGNAESVLGKKLAASAGIMARPEPAAGYDEDVQSPHLAISEEEGEEHAGIPAAPVVQKRRPIPHEMPHVPAQTEDDLRATKPHMATPPAVQYDSPEATDPLNKTVYMGAEFGSNLRHPEQMIEMRPGMGMGQVVSSGLGSEHSSPGGNRAAGYSPEMAQNGGEFMQGISAFDYSDEGVGYSMF
jgi:hypothetical protein